MVALLARLAVPLVFLVFALLFYLNIRDLPLEAKLLPELMLTVVGALLLWDLVDETLQWRRRPRRPFRDELEELRDRFRARGHRSIGTMALTFLWLFVGMGTLGFYVSTVAFIVAGLVLLGERRSWLVAVLTVAAITVTYVVFTMWLDVRLPTGMFL